MKLLIALSVLAVVAWARPDAEQYYDSTYDSFDVDSLIRNKRLLTSYAKCFLDKGPCTNEGKDFKKNVPEAVETSCAKCSPKQKIMAKKMIKAFQEIVPEEWEELKKKFDPEGKMEATINKFVEETKEE